MTTRQASYKCLFMDPPWNKEQGGGAIKRGADRHYPLVKTADLPDLIQGSGSWRPYRNAHVWICATNTCLPDALWLMKQLGATYKTNIAWVKTADPEQITTLTEETLALQMGLGQYARGSHELLLFGTIGAGQAKETWKGNRSIRSVVRARRSSQHSRKPDALYELVENISHGPRVEFFATKERVGWDQWGNVELESVSV